MENYLSTIKRQTNARDQAADRRRRCDHALELPASMVVRKISPALAAGCTVVLKPVEQTPLVAGAMFDLAKLAGFPCGVLNLAYALEGDAIGRELCTNPEVRKISFTGSTESAGC